MAASGSEIIRRALDDLKKGVDGEHERVFQNTSAKDVWDLVRKIEDEQKKRGRMRNMARIEPFLRSLESYAAVVDTFCQGFSPMAWVWGPVKLILTLARQYSSVLDKILDAYKSIADHLPRIDRLQATFREDEDFRRVLGFIYIDLAEFHQRTYKFFHRRGWAFLFAIDWGFFERRFKSILTSISFHLELVDKEAAAIHFDEMKKARDLDRREYEKEERQRQMMMLQAVRSWLSATEDGQEDFLTGLAEKRQCGTCEWILEDDMMKLWIEPTPNEPAIWLTGKPGGGKSVLASFLIQHLQSCQESATIYFFCGLNSKRMTCADLLRTLAFQTLQQNPNLASLVHERYVQTISTCSATKMKALLKEMFAVAKFVHVIIDGVDECEPATQQEIVKAISEIQRNTCGVVKILISSRCEPQIREPLGRKTHISLNGRTDGAVEDYVAQKVKEIQDLFPAISQALISRIEARMMGMAKGMFLWVRLVTAMLADQSTELELENAVEQLPNGLNEVYGRILNRLKNLNEPLRSRAFKILSWSCAASRTVTVREVADGVSLHPQHAPILNKKTRIHNPDKDIIDVCAPLVEKSSTGYLEIVHSSAKEFLLHIQSGPFVDISRAHFDIGSSCLSALIASFVALPLFYPNITPQDIEKFMIEGYFGLHAYAHDHWVSHVEDFFRQIELSGKAALSYHDLTTMIDLLENFSRVRRGSSASDQLFSPSERSHILLQKFQLSNSSKLSEFLEKWTTFRSSMTESATTIDTIEGQLESFRIQDPTYLSVIGQNIRLYKERLLGTGLANLPSYLDQEVYAAFRKELGQNVYECRYDKCGHFSRSLEQRLEHETSHKPLFPCPHCDFSGTGFKSRRDLDRHVKQYHAMDEVASVPHSLVVTMRSRHAVSMLSENGGLLIPNSGQWNEKGRKTQAAFFSHVFRALTLNDATWGSKGDQAAPDGQNSVNTSRKPSTIFAYIGQKIEMQQYQSLTEFRRDVDRLSQLDGMEVAGLDQEGVRSKIRDALHDAQIKFPEFACSGSSDAILRDVHCVSDTNPQTPHDIEELDVSCSNGDRGFKIHWSKSENTVLPDLLAQYGKDFLQIANVLKTKTAVDVADHFKALVISGRDDLEEMVLRAEAKVDESKDKNEAASLFDTEASSDAMNFSPFNGSATGSGTPATEHESQEHDMNPIYNFPIATTALQCAPLSDNGPSSSASSSHPSTLKRPADQEHDQDSEAVPRPKKYIRAAPRPAYCPYCKDPQDRTNPRRLHDDHTLMKHMGRFHSPHRKVWICKNGPALLEGKKNCYSCRSGKRFAAKHNAATHLRRKHFGSDATIETLIPWIEEVEEPNPHHQRSVSRDTEASAKPRISSSAESLLDQASNLDFSGLESPSVPDDFDFDSFLNNSDNTGDWQLDLGDAQELPCYQ